MRGFLDGRGGIWVAVAMVVVLTVLTIAVLRSQPLGI